MFRVCALISALIILAASVSAVFATESVPRVVGENSVSVYGSKEASKWVTTILSRFGTEGSAESPNLDVAQKVIRCDEKEVLQVKVVLREKTEVDDSIISEGRRKSYLTTRVSTPRKEVIHFHETGGHNVLVFDDGFTAYRKNEDTQIGDAGVLTNRPLKDDELFEVRLDRLIKKHPDYLGMGITKDTPSTVKYGSWMSSSTIIWYNHKIYGEQPKDYYAQDLRNLKVGSRVGVMRRKNGNVHFYVDGVDQGIAAVNVTGPLYGVLDVYGNTVQASIAWD